MTSKDNPYFARNLVNRYWGALFGGAITSILFNIPGEPWSVATTFDGYPLAQKGRAGEALKIGRAHV